MRILTSEWHGLRANASRYDIRFYSVDPRASTYNEELLTECLCNIYRDEVVNAAFSLPDNHIMDLPTRDDILRKAYEALDADAERNRKNIPEEFSHLVADPRVFASGIVSPEFASECEKKYSEYTEKADIIFGKWLWHTFEEIPLLGEEAVALTDALRFSTYNMEEDDKNLRIFNNNVSIKLIDVTFDRSSLSKMFDVRQCELYLEDGIWELHTVTSEGKEIEYSFKSFEISVKRGK